MYDFIAIGLGPFNLSLACMAEPVENLKCLFLDRKTEFNWHPGMLLDGTTLQNPFMADMVTLADPTSRYTYLNYAKQQGRLYRYFIRENWYLDRHEFNRYCQWVSAQLSNVRFAQEVQDITYDEQHQAYQVCGVHTQSGEPFVYLARKLVIGIGSSPRFPDVFTDPADAAKAIHSGFYLDHKAHLQRCKNVTVIGSGQSGAEIFYDLLQGSAEHGYSLSWVTRSDRFFQMETAKLTLELLTPEYADYFYGLPEAEKSATLGSQQGVFKGINQSLISKIYDYLDERSLHDLPPVKLLTSLSLKQASRDADGQWALRLQHQKLGSQFEHVTDGLVFASGYGYQLPAFIEGIRERIRWDEHGGYDASRSWAVDHRECEIYVQNVGLQSHGMANPDLGLACYRNGRLLHQLTGVDHYPSDPRIAFQEFSPSAGGHFTLLAG
ncbi:SidA/IucD/PvdA family monooxygenase [Ectopseudomonas mendocina]|uniref:SidA/IucD/PvdA family monooxygenase n=1 Tax=Ectopseudomonas mendocina TaxID=300 RepID=A0ABZ2RGC0_ECTME